MTSSLLYQPKNVAFDLLSFRFLFNYGRFILVKFSFSLYFPLAVEFFVNASAYDYPVSSLKLDLFLSCAMAMANSVRAHG